MQVKSNFNNHINFRSNSISRNSSKSNVKQESDSTVISKNKDNKNGKTKIIFASLLSIATLLAIFHKGKAL